MQFEIHLKQLESKTYQRICRSISKLSIYKKKAVVSSINAGSGCSLIELQLPDELFYQILSDRSGLDITDDKALVSMIKDLDALKESMNELNTRFVKLS